MSRDPLQFNLGYFGDVAVIAEAWANAIGSLSA